MRIVLFILVSLLSIGVFADAGNCVKYRVGLTLNSGEYLECFVFKQSYGTQLNFDKVSIKQFVAEQCADRDKNVTAFFKLTELAYPIIDLRNDCDFHLNATDSTNIRVINSDSISKAKLIEFNICHNCDDYNLSDGFYWSGVYPIVITELTDKEIGLLQKKPIASVDFVYPDDGTFTFKILSYNKLIDKEGLKSLCDKFLKDLESNIEQNNWNEMRKMNEEFKRNLREKSIVIFEYGFAT